MGTSFMTDSMYFGRVCRVHDARSSVFVLFVCGVCVLFVVHFGGERRGIKLFQTFASCQWSRSSAFHSQACTDILHLRNSPQKGLIGGLIGPFKGANRGD